MDHLPLFLGVRKVKSGLASVLTRWSQRSARTAFIRGLAETGGAAAPTCLTSWHSCWLEASALFHVASPQCGLSVLTAWLGQSKPRDPNGSHRLFMIQHQTSHACGICMYVVYAACMMQASYTFTSAILRGSQEPVLIQCGERPAKGPILEAGDLPPTYKDS